MTISNYFYNSTTKKYIALFGTLFNKMMIVRVNDDVNMVEQEMIVPISYGPYQKFLARITQDPDLDRKTAITLPRMSFEITSMAYDSARKLNSSKKIRSYTDATNFQYSPAPYNLEFSLSIMTKFSDDGVQILEQIIPFFKPEFTYTVNLMEGIEPFDVPIILNSVQAEDIYDGNFETRRSLLWNLNFTMKCWYFGPHRNKKIIKFVDSRLYKDMPNNINNPSSIVTVQPGLTSDNKPTSNIENTIPYEFINIDDDWGVIELIYDEEL